MSGWWLAVALSGCASDGTNGGSTLPDRDEDGDGWPASQDCDDAQVAVHPGAHDPWYDGVDSDCAGNDDYDLDGDGHASAAYGGDDCDDQAAAVSPSAVEVPYDGLDEDCDPATLDDDLDEDGAVGATDCDDLDPSRFPSAPEVLDDGHDEDCDGNPDAAAWGFSDLTFLSPRTPRLGRLRDVVVLSVSALDTASPTWFPGGDPLGVGVLLAFDPLATNGPAPAVAPELWFANDIDPPGDSDLIAVDDIVYLGTAYFQSENGFGYLQVQPLAWLGLTDGWLTGNPEYAFHPLVDWDHVDLAVDDLGQRWMCASDLDTVAYMQVAGPGSPSGSLSGVDGSGGCWSHAGAALTACDANGSCTDFVAPVLDDPPAVAASQPWGSDVFLSVRERDGVVAGAAATGGIVRIEGSSRALLLPDYTFTDAEILEDDDGATWVVAITDRGSGPEILLATIDGPSTVERWIAVHDGARTLAPAAASLLLTDQRVVLAVSALDVDGTGRDRVGWMFVTR